MGQVRGCETRKNEQSLCMNKRVISSHLAGQNKMKIVYIIENVFLTFQYLLLNDLS